MTGRELTLSDHLDHRVGETQETKKIRDRRAIFPSGISNLLMSKFKFLDEPLIAARLVDGIKIAALQIFDERENEARAVVEILHQRRDLRPTEVRNRAQTP